MGQARGVHGVTLFTQPQLLHRMVRRRSDEERVLGQMLHRRISGSLLLIVVSFASSAYAQVGHRNARDMVAAMLANEQAAAQHKDHYAYLSQERSERTGGHLWTEKVVETNVGKVRFLLEEDGQALSSARASAERGRLAEIVADPAAFQKKAQALKDDEAHARDMLVLLAKAFLFSEPREDAGYVRIDYRPNPEYQTQSMEERVLHGMSGTMLIEPKAMRLHTIEGKLPADVSIGFGFLATIRAGSNFATSRDPLGEADWKTTSIDTDIDGKAIFFKAIAKKQHAERSGFARVSNDLTVPQAVAIAEQ